MGGPVDKGNYVWVGDMKKALGNGSTDEILLFDGYPAPCIHFPCLEDNVARPRLPCNDNRTFFGGHVHGVPSICGSRWPVPRSTGMDVETKCLWEGDTLAGAITLLENFLNPLVAII